MMNAVEQVVFAMDAYVKEFNKYTNLVITKDSEVGTSMGQLNRDFAGFIRKNETGYDLSALHYMYSKWILYKVVYRFSEESFWNELINTEDTEVYLQILRRLPATTFLVVPPSGDNICYLIHIEAKGNEALFYTVGVSGLDGVRIYSGNAFMWINDGEKISEGLKRSIQKDGGNKDEDDYYGRAFGCLKMAVQVAYYLAAQNAVIKEVKTPKAARPKRPDGKPMNLRQWEVGYRIGCSYPDRARTGSGTTAPDVHHPAGNSPRPHMRRAHWHHYWAGKGKTELILKWLDPIMVNATGEIVATEHLAG